MEKRKEVANYTVRYNSDPRLITGQNHKSDDIYLIDTDEMNFKHLCKAIVFLSECTSAITKIEGLVPQLKDCKRYKYLLKEMNIKVQNQVTNKAELIKNSDLDWS